MWDFQQNSPRISLDTELQARVLRILRFLQKTCLFAQLHTIFFWVKSVSLKAVFTLRNRALAFFQGPYGRSGLF